MKRPLCMDPVITAVARSLLQNLTPSVDYALAVADNARRNSKGKAPARPLLDALAGRSNQGELANLFHLSPKAMGELNKYYFLAQRDLSDSDVKHCEAMVVTPILAATSLIRAHDETEKTAMKVREETSAWNRVLDRYLRQGTINGQVPNKIDAAEGILIEAASSLADFVKDRQDVTTRRNLAFGLLWATLSLLALVLIIGAAFFAVDFTTDFKLGHAGFSTLRDSLACVVAGGAGAATSVLFRLRQVSRVSHISSTLGSAIFRVTVGAFFALGILLLLKSHIVDILKDPAESQDASDITIGFFWAAAGFLAGFNERWVGHLLDRDKEAPETISARN